jgi:transposase-like protein
MVDLLLIAVPIIVIAFTIFFILLPRYGPHYTSRLKCPKCGKQFNYHWIPGATFTSLRYGNKRHLRCPYCHQVSIFDIAKTRVSRPKQNKIIKTE